MGKIYIVRHGETEWNNEGRNQGQTDIPLSEVGKAQAQCVAKCLSDIKFDAAYSSDLSRTHQTAQYITQSSDLEVITNANLRERSFGIFEGTTLAERELKYPELFEQSTQNDISFTPPEGESIQDTYQRIHPTVEEYKNKHIKGNIIIVGHGGSLRCVISHLLDLPLESCFKFVLSNCGITVFETFHNNTVLLTYNDTHHLEGMEIKEGY